MDISGERLINAPRAEVWGALNDEAVLKKCIPGCESIERVTDDEMTAVAKVKVGPLSARFTGIVKLCDIDAPNGYRIVGEGRGAAGFSKGQATVRLEDRGNQTLLNYAVEVDVGGKLAQIGARLISGTAKTLADRFFVSFANEFQPRSGD